MTGRKPWLALLPLVLLAPALAAPVPTRAKHFDWPQFLGPTRNGVTPETGLVETWPKKGPPVVWQREVGQGFAGPVVADGRLILFHRVGDDNVVECLEAATGKAVWKDAEPTSYSDRLGKGDGPRATPAIAGGRVYTLSQEGVLKCLDLKTGRKVWRRALHEDYTVPASWFGVGTSPLVEGKLVLVNVGGRDGAGIVAFDKDTGKEIWKATDQGASYASPVAATVDGKRYVFFFTREGLVLLDPTTGKVCYRKRWRAKFDASVNAASAVVVGDHVFVSACYNTGALLQKITPENLVEVWKNDTSLSCHFGTPVYHMGLLFGFHGRQEEGAVLRCVEWKTGKERWTEPGFGCGEVILAGDHLILLSENGDLVLAAADGSKYREKARASVLTGPVRAHPALADGLLFARDNKKLVCWNLKK